MNRQPGKALPYFLRLRRPNVFDLIRENNLFTAVQDQALLLVEFDHELIEKRRKEGEDIRPEQSRAIELLVDHIHSIPVRCLPCGLCVWLRNSSSAWPHRSGASSSSCEGEPTTYTSTWMHSSTRIRT